MTDTILCVDIGTSSLKAALMTDRPQPVFVSRQPLQRNNAQHWLVALKHALAELAQRNPDYAIEAICVSGNGPTIVAEDGTLLLHDEPLPTDDDWKCIQTALHDCQSLFLPRLAAFKHQFPQAWHQADRIFSGPEYLLYLLTGKAVTILPETRFAPAYWTDAVVCRYGFSPAEAQKLPPFVAAGTFAGTITEQAARATGLLQGTLVFCGAPDFVVALIGTGTVYPGRLCDRAGSSEGLNLCTSVPVFAPQFRTLPSIMPGLWNVSYLLAEPTLAECAKGVQLLKEAAHAAGETFPHTMMITGGQALQLERVAQKESACGLTIRTPYCSDAELIGDLILARVALGDFDDIEDGVYMLGL